MTEPIAKRPPRSQGQGLSNLEAQFEAQRLAFGPLMFQAARSLRSTGALEAIQSGGKAGVTAEELCTALEGFSLYAARLLLEAGLAARMLALESERYRLTKVGLVVLADPMTRVNFDFVHDVCYRASFHLEASLREGRPVGLQELGPWPTLYEGLSQLPERVQASWFAFDHLYSDGVFEKVLPRVFERPTRRLLDLGGNTGKWALACCRHDPAVQVTILDLPGQLARALESAAREGLAHRIAGQAIDFLDPAARCPEGFDALWLSQFLDCFDEPGIVSILRRCAAVMGPDTRLYILETFWDRQRYEAARFSLINTSLYFAAVANGNSKMYHSERMKHCIAEAGLRVLEEVDDIGLCHTLLRCGL